jgi:hypothetical protein
VGISTCVFWGVAPDVCFHSFIHTETAPRAYRRPVSLGGVSIPLSASQSCLPYRHRDSRVWWDPGHRTPCTVALAIAPGRQLHLEGGVAVNRGGGRSRRTAHIQRHTPQRIPLALRAHRRKHDRDRLLARRVPRKPRLAEFKRSRSASSLSRPARRAQLGRALPARIPVADPIRDQEPRSASRHHGRRRRRTLGPFLSKLRPGLRRPENSQQILHGVRLLQALP